MLSSILCENLLICSLAGVLPLKSFSGHAKSETATSKAPLNPLWLYMTFGAIIQLKEVRFLQPDYADHAKINIAGILRQWKRSETPSAYLVPKSSPTSMGGPCLAPESFLVPRSFNIAYNTGIFKIERLRIQLLRLYILL